MTLQTQHSCGPGGNANKVPADGALRIGEVNLDNMVLFRFYRPNTRSSQASST